MTGSADGVAGAFSGSVGRALLRVQMPERVWIHRHDALVVYVHETWESVVVTTDPAAIGDLRALLAQGATH